MIQHFAASELCKITLQNEAAATDDDIGEEGGAMYTVHLVTLIYVAGVTVTLKPTYPPSAIHYPPTSRHI